MKILLVGATGTLGRQIAKQAIEDGHEVRCFVRNPRKASFLQEWGCELTKGNLLNSSDIEYALQDIEVVIDAATSKPDDPKSIYEIDWDGKLNLFNACESLNVKRVIFLSILLTEKFRNVPLMDIKYCTEKLLEKSDLEYTIFKCAAFMQGVIGQFAIPILDHPYLKAYQKNHLFYLLYQQIILFASIAGTMKLSNKFNIHRTRKNFPNDGIDTFENMAKNGIKIVDKVVLEELNGKIDSENKLWLIPK